MRHAGNKPLPRHIRRTPQRNLATRQHGRDVPVARPSRGRAIRGWRHPLIGAALAFHALSFACAAPQSFAPLESGVNIRSNNAVLFFVDGLDTERLCAIDDAGQTPNIRRHFNEEGLRFTHATACFPTVTYSNAVSLLTGRYPGRHGVTANAWFDRFDQRYVDYATALTYLDVDRDYDAKTVYEVLAPLTTSSAQCAASRGATWRWQAPLANGLNWALHDYEAVDSRVGGRVHDVIRRARREGQWPVFQTYYFPGVDKVAHTNGVASARYSAAIANVDQQIGAIIACIESTAGPDKTHYWLVSDHGQMDCAGHRDLDLLTRLRRHTGKVVVEPDRTGVRRSADVILIPGRRHAVLHVRGGDGWHQPAEDASVLTVVNALRNPEGSTAAADASGALIPGIRCVYYRLSGQRIGVIDPAGDRVISAASGVVQVIEDSGDARFRGELAALFESPRAGDVIVFADEGWIFQAKDCGGHGGASLRERRIPLMVKGPGIPAGAHCDMPVRIVDVMPTMVDLLGMKDRLPVNLDGRSFRRHLRAESIGNMTGL